MLTIKRKKENLYQEDGCYTMKHFSKALCTLKLLLLFGFGLEIAHLNWREISVSKNACLLRKKANI